MTLRRICTINGSAYKMTGYCTVCRSPMWTSIDRSTDHAGCTATHCVDAVDPQTTTAPDATGYSTVTPRRVRTNTNTNTDADTETETPS